MPEAITELDIRAVLVEALLHAVRRPEVTARLAALNPGESLDALGLDSIDGVEWCMEIETRCRITIDSSELVEHDSLMDLARLVKRRMAGDSGEPQDIGIAPREGIMPLSFAQESVWWNAAKGSVGYSLGFVTRIDGPLDIRVLRDCLSFIAGRHEILRTSYTAKGQAPAQIIHPPAQVSLPVVELATGADPDATAETLLAAEMAKVTDLTELPLIRFLIVRSGKNEHWLLRACHHILWDAGTSQLFFAELAELYPAFLAGKPAPLPAIALLQYADYAVWQRRNFADDTSLFRDSVAWWKAHFTGLPPQPRLPFERPAPIVGLPAREGVFTVPVAPSLDEAASRFCRETGVTVHAVWLAALSVLLMALTRSPVLAVGTYVTGRRRAPLKTMLGDFACLTLPVFRSGAAMNFRTAVAGTRETLNGAEAHADLSAEFLWAALVKDGVALPAAHLSFFTPLSQAVDISRIGDLAFTDSVSSHVAVMPSSFSIALNERDHAQSLLVQFDAGRYDPPLVKAFIARLQEFLSAVLREPDRPLGDVLTAAVPKPV